MIGISIVAYTLINKITIKLNITDIHKKKTRKYNEILLDSVFSLCPSGSGPNSIRFWESLACGSIPVLQADTLDLPYSIDWDDAIIKINENDVQKIPKLLEILKVKKK